MGERWGSCEIHSVPKKPPQKQILAHAICLHLSDVQAPLEKSKKFQNTRLKVCPPKQSIASGIFIYIASAVLYG